MSNTCGRCTTTWTGTRLCHCGNCHRSFSGLALFDAHRLGYGERGNCLDPATLTIRSGNREGEPVMHLRDGVWSGPEMTDEQKTARFGSRGAA